MLFTTQPIAFALRELVDRTDLSDGDHPAALSADGHQIMSAPVDGPFVRTFTVADRDGYRITVHNAA